jgi:hypothetical protein
MVDSPFQIRLGRSGQKLGKISSKSGISKADIVRLAVDRLLAEFATPEAVIAAIVESKSRMARKAGK